MVTPQHLGGDVYATNSYPACGVVVTDVGLLAVDCPARPSDARRWGDFLRGNGRLRYLIVSEHHRDHCVSAWFLKPDVIVSSDITLSEIGKSVPSREAAMEAMIGYEPDVPTRELDTYELLLPTMTYSERMTLEMGGQSFVLFKAPGHTRGSTVVHAVDARVAFVSDLLVLAYHSADVWGWFATLGVLEALDVDWYVIGHGAPVRRSRIAEVREDLLEVVARARRLRQEVSRDEFIESGQSVFEHVRPDDTVILPKALGGRSAMLKRKGLENLYAYLDDSPAGSSEDRRDPYFEILV